jgi:hypothetical protein
VVEMHSTLNIRDGAAQSSFAIRSLDAIADGL